MQNRYAGDIGDYGKFGMLRALASEGLSIGGTFIFRLLRPHGRKHILPFLPLPLRRSLAET